MTFENANQSVSDLKVSQIQIVTPGVLNSPVKKPISSKHAEAVRQSSSLNAANSLAQLPHTSKNNQGAKMQPINTKQIKKIVEQALPEMRL